MRHAYIINEPIDIGGALTARIELREVGDDANAPAVDVYFVKTTGKGWLFTTARAACGRASDFNAISRILRGIAEFETNVDATCTLQAFVAALDKNSGRQVVVAGRELRAVTRVRVGEPSFRADGVEGVVVQAESATVAARRCAAAITARMESHPDEAAALSSWFAKGRPVSEIVDAVAFVPVSTFN